MVPLAGNIWGLIFDWLYLFLAILISFVGPWAVISQIIGTLNDQEIGKGNIPASNGSATLYLLSTLKMAVISFLPALGLSEAKAETVEVGVPSVLYLRFLNGVPRVLVAWVASIGLYQ